MRQLPIRSVLADIPNAPSVEADPPPELAPGGGAPTDFTAPGANPPLERLAWYAVLFAQTAFPHSEVPGQEYERRNGNVSLSLLSPSRFGIPYGLYPRLILIWLTTEAQARRTNLIEMPFTFGAFAEQLGINLRWGSGQSAERLKDQLLRLLNLSVRASLGDRSNHHEAGAGYHVASRYSLWWDSAAPGKTTPHANFVQLSHEFSELLERRYPIDIGLVREIAAGKGRGACLALDLYLWLAQRTYNLSRPLSLPLSELALQLGSAYGRQRDLARQLRQTLPTVLRLYPVRVELEGDRLTIHPPSASLLRAHGT